MEKDRFIGQVDFEELRSQRIQVYRTIELDLTTARADVKMDFTGNYVYALDATDIDSTLSLRLNEQSRSLLPLYKGRGYKAPFYRFFVTNAVQAGKTLTLAIGIESGTFEVFDVGKALEISGSIYTSTWLKDALEGNAFTARISRAPTAGNYILHQLWNPADSGVKCYLSRVFGWTDAAATRVTINHHNLAIATLEGSGVNKHIGEAASQAELRYEDTGSTVGTQLTVMKCRNVEPFEWEPISFFPAVIVPPGKGIVAFPIGTDIGLETMWEWVEVAE